MVNYVTENILFSPLPRHNSHFVILQIAIKNAYPEPTVKHVDQNISVVNVIFLTDSVSVIFVGRDIVLLRRR